MDTTKHRMDFLQDSNPIREEVANRWFNRPCNNTHAETPAIDDEKKEESSDASIEKPEKK